MKKYIKGLGVIVFILSSLVGCNSTDNNDETELKDEFDFRVGDDDNIDWMLFNYVKNYEYIPVYKFQESFTDKYGKRVWEDFWIIDDFTLEEFNEMKKYKDYSWYYNDVVKSTKNRKYTWKKVK